MSKKQKIVKELKSWGITLLIVGVLYFTGWHKYIISSVQRVVIATGLIQPKKNLDLSTTQPIEEDFILSDIEGNPVRFSDFRGKVVLINFWATWCPPCIAEMPDIHNLYKSFPNEEVVFLMISRDEKFEKAIDFVRKKGFEFPIYQLASSVPGELQSNVLPTTYVISKDGKVATKKSGFASYNTDDFRNYLIELSNL